MILHLLDDEKFTNHAIRLFEDAFPGGNLYLVGVKKNKAIKYSFDADRVSVKVIGSVEYFDFLKSSDYNLVVIHGYNEYKQKLVVRGVLKGRVALILWGSELYNRFSRISRRNCLESTNRLRRKTFLSSGKLHLLLFEKLIQPLLIFLKINSLNKKAFEKLDFILTNISGDYDLLLSEINTKPALRWFSYYSLSNITQPELLTEAVGNNILIGNSASYTNNHMEVFEKLKSFPLGNRKLIVPLSYGDLKYAKVIEKQGKAFFWENFQPLLQFINLSEYNRILQSCSVIIFNHVRQQGIGNITASLYLGKKVFLRTENTAYAYFKSLGVVIYDMEKLDQPSLDMPLSEVDQQRNKRIIEKEFDSIKVVQAIRESFQDFVGQGRG